MRKLTLVMTHQCNFRCSYCPQVHEDVVMSKETAFRAVDLLEKMLLADQQAATVKVGEGVAAGGIKNADAEAQKSEGGNGLHNVQISFYGGEPLLAEGLIRQVVEYAEQKLTGKLAKKVLFEITTNGLLLREDFLAYARQHNMLLALSHDGVGQDFSRKDRGGNATKERADETLRMMLRYAPRTIIMMTLHPDLVGTLCDSMRFFHDFGVKYVNLTLANGPKVNWTEEKKEILMAQLEEMETLYEAWNQGEETFIMGGFDNKIRDYIKGRCSDDKMCHFSEEKLMIDCDGRFFPCNHFIGNEDFCIGDLEAGPNTEFIESLDAQRVESETCRSCAFAKRCRHNCACANHGNTGDMCRVSVLQCEYEKAIIRLADQAAAKLISAENPKFVERMYRE